MKLETAVMRAIGGAVEAAPPASVSESVRALGGSRAAAEALGVTQRTIQRYTKFEREGKGPDTREASAATREKLGEAAAQKTSGNQVSIARLVGMKVYYDGEANVSGETGRVRQFNFTIEPGSVFGNPLDTMLDAYERGDERAAAGGFVDAVQTYYKSGMELGDVDELTMQRYV